MCGIKFVASFHRAVGGVGSVHGSDNLTEQAEGRRAEAEGCLDGEKTCSESMKGFKLMILKLKYHFRPFLYALIFFQTRSSNTRKL